MLVTEKKNEIKIFILRSFKDEQPRKHGLLLRKLAASHLQTRVYSGIIRARVRSPVFDNASNICVDYPVSKNPRRQNEPLRVASQTPRSKRATPSKELQNIERLVCDVHCVLSALVVFQYQVRIRGGQVRKQW